MLQICGWTIDLRYCVKLVAEKKLIEGENSQNPFKCGYAVLRGVKKAAHTEDIYMSGGKRIYLDDEKSRAAGHDVYSVDPSDAYLVYGVLGEDLEDPERVEEMKVVLKDMQQYLGFQSEPAMFKRVMP